MKTLLRQLILDEQGAAMLQYGVLAGLIAVLAIPLVIAAGTHLGLIWAGFQGLFATIAVP